MKNIEVWSETKLWRYKPESTLENVTSKILWDFERQKDQLILTWKQAGIIYKKLTCRSVDFPAP